jgi:hypothetical protein
VTRGRRGEASGPPGGGPLTVDTHLIVNDWLPDDGLPLMSVAVQRNLVMLVRWKTSPGSRGPVESHVGKLDVGLEPSIV